MDLHGVLECKAEPVVGKVKSVITLTTKLRDWSFGAETDAEMNDWVGAIRNALAALDRCEGGGWGVVLTALSQRACLGSRPGPSRGRRGQR